MKKTILATTILSLAVSFGATNDTVDVRLLDKRIERIERVLELGDFPTYCEFTNAVWTVVKNRNCACGAKFEASKVLRRAGVDANLFKDHPRGHKITYHKKSDLVKNPPKEGRIFALKKKTLDDFKDNDWVQWITYVDDSDENRLKNCKPLLSDR